MTSYEGLADAAFAAAVDVQLKIEGLSSSLESFQKFAKLLKEPILPESEYKLLHDARNLPLYKAAWSNTYGQRNADLKPNVLLTKIAELLCSAEVEIDNWKKEDKQKVADFCLALNRAFLEENAKTYNMSYSARAMHASS
jgi:hypothetical protein